MFIAWSVGQMTGASGQPHFRSSFKTRRRRYVWRVVVECSGPGDSGCKGPGVKVILARSRMENRPVWLEGRGQEEGW